MALHGKIGESEVSLKLIKAGPYIYELNVQGPITITRSINVASTLSCKVLRDKVTVEKGDTIDFTLDGEHHQFFGIVMDTEKSNEWVSITAYDQIWYLNKNTRHISYENITLNELLERLCSDRGYSVSNPPQFEDTVHKLPPRVEENTSELAIITNAIDALYPMSKVRYFLWDDAGYLRLNSTNWLAGEPTVVVSPEYFEDYSLKETLQEGYSVVRLEKKVEVKKKEGDKEKTEYENKTYQAIDQVSNDNYGTIEYYGTVEEGENGKAKAKELVRQFSYNFFSNELNITGMQGDITVRGGTPLLVDFYSTANKEYIRGWYETQTVTHTIDKGHHTMDLTMHAMKTFDEWTNNNPDYYSNWAYN